MFHFLYLRRMIILCFFVSLCSSLQANTTSHLDLFLQDYITRRTEKCYFESLFSFLKPIYVNKTPITYQLCTDLDLISKNGTDLTYILETELSLATCSGKALLTLELLHPTTDIDLLEKKQALIKFFIQKSETIPHFEAILQNICDWERSCLVLLTKNTLSLKEKKFYLSQAGMLLDNLYNLFDLIERLEIEELYSIKALLYELFFNNTDFAQLRHLLHSRSFTSFFSNPLTIMKAYNQYKKDTTQSFSLLFEIIGKLDLALSAAKLLRNQSDHYCFATYSQANHPIFNIQGSWHPLLLTHKTKNEIITNNFCFEKNRTSIILTGSNAAGKTVVTCGFATAVLLAQTLTIAPAKSLILTPFSSIYTILTSRSNIESGKSRFMSEIETIKQLITHLEENQKNGGYTFLVLDEIFTGTDQTSGIQAAQTFLKQYTNHSFAQHTLLFLSTHYLELTKTPQQCASFCNYKIDITRTKSGALDHTFKLSPGTSQHSTAIDLTSKLRDN